MELYKYPHNRNFTDDDFCAWAFIAIISGKTTNGFFDGINTPEMRENGIPIELKINGFEFNFTQVLKRLEEDFDRQVEAKAKKLLEERAADVQQKLYQLEQAITQSINNLFPEDY
jgi:hypothetical protein